MKIGKAITATFNIILLLYLFYSSMISYYFDPEFQQNVPWDEVYIWSPTIAVISTVIVILIAILWGAALIKVFWNRFIADVFKLRAISFNESIAIVLMISIAFV